MPQNPRSTHASLKTPPYKVLLQQLTSHPGDPLLLHRISDHLDQQERWVDLRRVLSEQIAHLHRDNPFLPHALYRLAKAHLELGEARQAAGLAKRAIQMQPTFAYSHHVLGRALARQGRFQEAVAAQERCVALEPGFSWAWYELGLALLELDASSKALAALRHGIQLEEQRPGNINPVMLAARDRAEKHLTDARRQRAARQLWPDMTTLPARELLPVPMRLALLSQELKLMLEDSVTQQPQPAASCQAIPRSASVQDA